MARAKPGDFGKSQPKIEWDDMEEQVAVVTIAGYEQGEDDREDPPRPILFLRFEQTGDSVLYLGKQQIEYLIAGLDTDEMDDWIGCDIPIERVRKTFGKKEHKKVWVAPDEDWADYNVGKKRTRTRATKKKTSRKKATTKRKRTKRTRG